MDPAYIALVGTLCGGVGLKVAEHFLGQGKIRVDEATTIRGELRQQIADQRAEITMLEHDVDKWRKDYYDLRDKYVSVQTELQLLLDRVKGPQKNDTE